MFLKKITENMEVSELLLVSLRHSKAVQSEIHNLKRKRKTKPKLI